MPQADPERPGRQRGLPSMSPVARGLLLGFLFLVLLLFGGGLLLQHLGQGRWTLGDSLYMAAISASTVGYGELPGFEQVPYARLVAVVIVVLGLGTFAYLQSLFTAFLVEGELWAAFRRRRMNRRIEALSGHYVVAGCGSTGLHVVQELAATRRPFVVIDRDREHLQRLAEELGDAFLYVQGDATNDHVLQAAGVARASGVVAALTHDPDNLFVTVSARALNASARIVTKVVELDAGPKMLRAGANATVSPTTIGGLRMVSELVRPNVVEFLDVMLRDRTANMRFEEVTVPEGSRLVGRTLGEVPIREQTGALVVGRRGRDRTLVFNPAPATRIEAGEVLVLLARADELDGVRRYLGA